MNKSILTVLAGFMCSGLPGFAQEINVTPTGVEVGAVASSASGSLMQQSGQTTSFVTKDGINPPEVHMVIKGDGKVGIGVIDPSQKLTVIGNGLIRGTPFEIDGDASILYLGDTNHSIKSIYGGGIRLSTYAAEDALCIQQSTGNMGIGTSIPQGKLSVNFNGGDQFAVYSPVNNGLAIQTVLDNQLLASYGTYGGNTENRLIFQPLVGNVGIGTVNPTEKLTVNGKVKSRGYITDTSGWSDYVFNKDYKLPTLTEVEQHIAEKGHLPGIPSEKEVMANGVDLGDMQVKLLAQIEQLTLHMIAHQKAINALQQENASLKRELKSVTKPE